MRGKPLSDQSLKGLDFVFFIGIDIGKRNHEVALIDEKGIAIGKTLRITNTQSGSAKLLNFFKQN